MLWNVLHNDKITPWITETEIQLTQTRHVTWELIPFAVLLSQWGLLDPIKPAYDRHQLWRDNLAELIGAAGYILRWFVHPEMVSHPSALQWADVSNFAGVMNDVIGYRSTKLQPDKTHINIIHLHIQCRSTDGSHSCFYGIQLTTIHHNNVTSASQKTTMAAEI